MTANIASSNAAMDVCSSPEDRSYDARPPAAEKSAAAHFEGGGGVEAGKRTGAATRLDYSDVSVTAGDGGTRPPQVEGVVTTDKIKQVTLEGFRPQEGTKEVNKEA